MDHPPCEQLQPLRILAVDRAYKYRTPSKIIAVVDIVLCSLEILGLFAYATMDVGRPPFVSKVEHLRDLPEDKVGLVASMLVWVHLHISVLMLLFAFRLLTATKQETPIREALVLAKSWRAFSVVLLVLFILFPGVVAGLIDDLRYLLSTGLRVACVIVVNKFIRELKTELGGGGGELGGDYTKLPEQEGAAGEGLLVGTGGRYRIRTRKISTADVILTNLELVAVGVLGADVTETLLQNFHHFHYFPAKYVWIASVSIFAVHLLLTTTYLIIKSIELGAATCPSSELPEAIVIVQEWRVIKFLPLFLNSVPFLAGFGPSWALIWILVRLSAVLMVHRYLRELEKRLEEEGGALQQVACHQEMKGVDEKIKIDHDCQIFENN